jgi:hypothetical protein
MSNHHEYLLYYMDGPIYTLLDAYSSIKRIKRRTPIQKNNIFNIRIWLIIVKRLITLDRSIFIDKSIKFGLMS